MKRVCLALALICLACATQRPAFAQSPRPVGNEVFSRPPQTDPEVDRKTAHSWRFATQGNEMLKQKRYKEAQALFEQAIQEIGNR